MSMQVCIEHGKCEENAGTASILEFLWTRNDKKKHIFFKERNWIYWICTSVSLEWRHNGHDIVSNHQPYDCLLNRLFRHRSKKTSKFRVTGLCAVNSPRPVNSPHKGPVTRKMSPFDDVIMIVIRFTVNIHSVFIMNHETYIPKTIQKFLLNKIHTVCCFHICLI